MNIGKDRILVTGATGQQGGAVAHELLTHGHQVRVMTRHPEGDKAKALAAAGAEVVRGDLDDQASLEKAVAGAWGVYAVQNTWEAGVEREEEQGKRLARVAKERGVHHFVQGSVASAQRHTGIPHFENKWRIEETVRSLGFPSHAVIRPVYYMENLIGPLMLPAIQQGKLDMAIAPTTTLQMVAIADVGKHGRRAFEKHQELNGKGIDVASDELTMPQVAEVLSQATGHPVAFTPSPLEAVRQFSQDYAVMLEWFDRVGYDVDIPRLARESGIEPTPLRAWVKQSNWATAPATR
jgi:uncharacterized protein YbjT (DUF2867 family)